MDPDESPFNVALIGTGTAAPAPHTVTLTANPTSITANGTSISTLTAIVMDQYGDPVSDGTAVVSDTDHGTLGLSTVPTSGGVASANLTSESSTETVIATVTAMANGASDATAVFFIPEGGAEVVESQTEIVSGSGNIINTATGGDVNVDATGDHNITIAEYEDNPGGTPTFQATGDYYDVHLDDDTNVNSLTIEFCPATTATIIYYWDGANWLAASDQYYDPTKACVVVTITPFTFPSLSDLTGLVFGMSEITGLPMSEFKITQAKLDFKKKPDDDKVRVQGELALDLAYGDDVDIPESVTVTVWELHETITMVEKGKKGEKWKYKRPKGVVGSIKEMKIDWKKGTFEIKMDNADLTGITNPVTIGIQIGDCCGGEETIEMKEEKHHWDYK